MKCNSLLSSFIVTAFCLFASNASSFQVDTLMLAGNEKGNGMFTVSNSEEETIYLKAEVLKVVVEHNQIKKIPLNINNFMLWDLAVNPAKAILHPGEMSNFSVRYLCRRNCDRSEDNVYQVRFTPVVSPDAESQNKLDIRFGIAPYYIVPALESDVKYDIDFDKQNKQLAVRNTGNTFIKIKIDSCDKFSMDQKGCRALYYVLAGRSKTIKLSDKLYRESLKVIVGNHDQSYNETITL
ncbi:hypothetical protein [Vibrio coralliilyticus]|uniref:hypothetical protein n=1 Tax=Vibrio coralliilyticus TaxID=190893 RepID=UPI0006CC49AF|nr:hypothetical protein [Vibrio coralliilyticus]AXN30473.1 hypothetical protein DVV14_03790 [Vibrio coralliilyticus]KPH26860.1 hypothetical protein ADU60_00965 [Vibrio coralliilyticus]